MAILGLGTDIVEIARIEAVISRSVTVWQDACSVTTNGQSGRRISSRCVFWQSALRSKRRQQKPLARVFAMGWRLISLKSSTMNSVSRVCGYGEALKLAEKLGVAHMHVTLADERHYACATVIIES